jgi:tetratricopeptide (TPR) repeat protein
MELMPVKALGVADDPLNGTPIVLLAETSRRLRAGGRLRRGPYRQTAPDQARINLNLLEPALKISLIILCCALALASCAPRQALEGGETGMLSLDYVSLATICEQQGDLKGAIAALKRARQADPGSALIDLMIAQDYYELGNDTLAALYARRAIKIDPGNADNYLVLGNSFMIAREFEDALQQYRIAAGLRPAATDIQVTLAGLYEAAGQPDSAVAILQRQAVSGSDPAVRHALASALTRRKRWDDAIAQYRQLLAADSTDLKASYSLGLLFEIQGQADSAVEYFDRASALQPANTSIRRHIFNMLLAQKEYTDAIIEAEDILEQEPADGNMRLQLARLYYLQQDYDAAAGQFRALLEVDSANAEALYTLARLRFQQKRYAEAAEHYRKTLRILPKLDEAWVNLGVCQLQAGQADSAGYSFRQARKHGSTMDLDYLFGFGYSQLEQYGKAIPYYQRDYPRRAKDVPFLFNFAAAYERAGDYDNAEAYFLRLLQLDPKHASALNYLGYMYADRGLQLETALQEIELALREDPDNSAYLDSRGWAKFRLGRLQEARADLEAAIRNGGQDAVIHEHLGDVLSALKLYGEALRSYQEALARDPQSQGLKSKIRNTQDQLR